MTPTERVIQAAETERALSEQAFAVLRQIAGMPRRTREQRLASSCLSFIDAMNRLSSPSHANCPRITTPVAGLKACSGEPQAAPSAPMQVGLSSLEISKAWHQKLPGVAPTDTALSAFAAGIEYGIELAAARAGAAAIGGTK